MKRAPFEIKKTRKYGRGLYATRNIKAGEVVETSPVLILDEWEASKITSTKLNLYVFDWGKESAIALGVGSLFNHSVRRNVTYSNNARTSEIVFTALCDIKEGHQLFIKHGYDPVRGAQVTAENRRKA